MVASEGNDVFAVVLLSVRVSIAMDRTQPNLVKIPANQPRDLLARLYREIGISAVAAALEPASFAVEEAVRPAPQNQPIACKAAA